jgi:hypothetical protein
MQTVPDYRVVPDWEQLPAGMTHKDVPDVAVDSADRVYLITRQQARVLVYEPDGTFLADWGLGVFSSHPHAITIGPDDTVYVVDEHRNCVEAYTTSGELIRTIGPSGAPTDTGADPAIPDIYDRIASIQRAAGPYNHPTKLAVAPGGDFYISDGYANARVHHYSAAGDLLHSWGEPGTGPGQFHLVHSVAVAPDGTVLVCDRENDRIQLFSPQGEFTGEWTDFHRPSGIVIRHDQVYISELPWRPGFRTWRNGTVSGNHPGRITVRTLGGTVLATFGGVDPFAPGGLSAPHGLCVDAQGDLYVAEVTWTDGVRKGIYPEDFHTFLKLSGRA